MKDRAWHTFTHPEFWPQWAVYWPLYLLYLPMAAYARRLDFFTLANPAFHLGGIFSEGKYETLQLIPKGYRPAMVLVPVGATAHQLAQLVDAAQIAFPAIAKPDTGARGQGVKVVNDLGALTAYLTNAAGPTVVQAMASQPHEYGVFVVRCPRTNQTKITSFMKREFFAVVGDGTSTIGELVAVHPRYKMYTEIIHEQIKETINDIPRMGERVVLQPIGNHCRGTIFRDMNAHITPQLAATFGQILRDMGEVYYGRFDVKAESLQALEQGDMSVLEFNGAHAEPAHIYDPKTTPWQMWSAIVGHWWEMAKIARHNHGKAQNTTRQTLTRVWAELRSARS